MNASLEPPDDELADRLQQSRRLEDAPRALVERAIGIWSAPPSAIQAGSAVSAGVPPTTWADTAAAVRRLAAALISDSGFAPAPALGLRAAGRSARQILLHAEGLDIDLRVTAAPDGASGWMLAGQVLGPNERGEVHVGVDTLALSAPIGELGEFRCGPLPVGRWHVVLQLDALLIELPPIDVPGSGGA